MPPTITDYKGCCGTVLLVQEISLKACTSFLL